MPIRINLLAEVQAAEEERRRDPVKGAILGGIVIVMLVLVYSSLLQVKVMSSKTKLGGFQSKWKAIEQDYQQVVENRRKSFDVEDKLVALQRLTTNRFLWGETLSAFQQTMKNLEGVQVLRFRAEQSYTQIDDAKSGTSSKSGRTKPATGKSRSTSSVSAVERLAITIEAKDASAQPGEQVNKFKAAIASAPHFSTSLLKTNGVLLASRSAPIVPLDSSAPYVTFTLQCSYPEKIRR